MGERGSKGFSESCLSGTGSNSQIPSLYRGKRGRGWFYKNDYRVNFSLINHTMKDNFMNFLIFLLQIVNFTLRDLRALSYN